MQFSFFFHHCMLSHIYKHDLRVHLCTQMPSPQQLWYHRFNRHIIKKHEKHTALLEPGREHQNLHVSNLIKMTSPNQNLISTDWVTDFINPLAELLRKGQYLPFLIDTGVVVFRWSMAWSLSNWDIPFISSH